MMSETERLELLLSGIVQKEIRKLRMMCKKTIWVYCLQDYICKFGGTLEIKNIPYKK